MRFVLLSVFFLSGLCSLVYETAWSRQLVPVFGSSHFAVTAVLTAFMAGLAVGGWVFGKIADRVRHPLRLYALLEALTAVCALLIPLGFGLVQTVYDRVAGPFMGHFYFLSVIRLFLVLPVLFPAAFFMGATFPVISRYLTRTTHETGVTVGALYAANSFGAVAGTVLTGFLFLRVLGTGATIRAAAFVNLFLVLVLLLLAAKMPYTRPSPETPRESGLEPAGGSVLPAVLTAFGLSGFAAMTYEIVWTRLLIFPLGTQIHAFTTMLAAFIFGLALGGAIFGRLADRSKSLIGLLGLMQVAAGVISVAMIPLFNILPGILDRFYTHGVMTSRGAELTVRFLLCVLTMLPVTLILGGLFPVVAAAAVRDLPRLGEQVGGVYAANTAGAVLGTFCAGCLLVPFLGLKSTLLAAAGLNFLAGAIVFFSLPASKPGWKIAALAAGLIIIVILPKEITLGKTFSRMDLVYSVEDMGDRVSVFRARNADFKLMTINGIGEVPTDALSMRIFKMEGHFPLLFHGPADRALIVSFGAGIVSGAAVMHDVREVTCVEICRGVFNAAGRTFGVENRGVLTNSRFRKVVEDGRNFLAASDTKYGVIMVDCTHPAAMDSWVLYTREFFNLCRSRLEPDGLLSMWIPLHGLSVASLRSIVRSFLAEFPSASFWLAGAASSIGHGLLIGSAKPLNLDAAVLERRLGRGGIGEDLKSCGLETAGKILSTRLLEEKGLSRFSAGAAENTDDRSFIGFPYKPAGLLIPAAEKVRAMTNVTGAF